jgi:hypothetical protein
LRTFITHIIICFSLGACIKEIPYQTDSRYRSLPAVHCFITPDSFVTADCRLTAPFGNKDMTVADARFTIWKAGQTLDSTLYFGNGIHRFTSNILKAGDSFVFNGTISGGQPFSINCIMPKAIPIKTFDTTWNIVPGVGRAFTLLATFNDDAMADNYSRSFLYKTSYRYVYDYTGKLTDSFLKKEIIAMFSDNPAAMENNYNTYSSREVLFSDATFKGMSKLIEFYTTDPLAKTTKERPVSIEFHLENISKSLYEFYNTRNAHIWQQQSISQLPGMIKGNVPGAYGVVGAYTSDFKLIQLKR